MNPRKDVSPAALVGKQVTFKSDADHADCWHRRNGLTSGVVLRVARSLAQKAELLGSEDLSLPELTPEESAVVRVWVKVDPCPSYPRGCEVAVEADCLALREE